MKLGIKLILLTNS